MRVFKTRRWRAWVLPALLLALWATTSHYSASNRAILVPPAVVWHTLWHAVSDGSLPAALAATVVRAFGGLLLGALSGAVLGIILGTCRLAHRLFSPTFNGAQQIALFAWIPLLSAWVGTGEGLKITEIALGAFFPMLLSTREGCAKVPEAWREVGLLLELGRFSTLRRIILPAALPTIMSGFETAFTIAWLGTIGTEYLVGTGYVNGFGNGLGIYLAAARMYGDMDKVIVGVLALALAGVLLNRFIAALSRRATPWLLP
ncbi:Alkanesulfonates transport system permease protein [Paramixta manurensis]|uniref:Alkanesulfonates transport system permease protein n=1 Tax=Paramixta manurensis TaxID=2740817 RepID=A0A6M8UEJ3_9GAMM|nr:Alkanesulfonates transport system permease protein [Erwiniaceae bacterium PD-1]